MFKGTRFPVIFCVSRVKEFDLLCAQAWCNMQIEIKTNVNITVTEKLNGT